MMNLSDSHTPGFDQGLSPTPAPLLFYWPWSANNDWQLIASALVGLQSVPGLIILYGSMVKKKWAVNSAFMALYAFAAVLLFWVLFVHRMSFGDRFGPLLGRPAMAVPEEYLTNQASGFFFPNATYVFFQFVFAAITVILLAGSLLGRMNFYAWMLFVPLWLTASYSVGAFTVWGGGFLETRGVLDFAGGYVIHVSSGVAGFTAAYWVGPRISNDRQDFPPNNIINMLFGAGLLWLGWSGFNGGAQGSPDPISSLAILNTHLCTATSLFIWLTFDMLFYHKSSVIGAVQGMITGLVCITPAAGLVQPWAAMLMGLISGSVPWYTMMVLHRRIAFFQKVDDTLGAFHTHAVAGALGGLIAGLLAHPRLTKLVYPKDQYQPGLLYTFKDGKPGPGFKQLGDQILGAVFIAVWNIVVTTLICLAIRIFMPLRMDEEDLRIGDDAVHGEEAYALWGDGLKTRTYVRWSMSPVLPAFCRGPRGC
ncbi:ammonium transporter 2 member 3-like [Elaeis guineensis]|uniref:Ammonium transporter n=1 Tax=Elaeis guineensis var. tenera TaxID=51953 RepID=A0A6J0PSC0_ELAGV|nr:LOW QUALITY PROTEIN: ammonium transporter 2-like [Elaeis guineensis]